MFVFDQRTKAVMAQAAQDGIKEKVSSGVGGIKQQLGTNRTLVSRSPQVSVEQRLLCGYEGTCT